MQSSFTGVNLNRTVTARDELQVHYDTFIEEYSNKLIFDQCSNIEVITGM